MFDENKTNDKKQEFAIEKDKYEKYEASVNLTVDEQAVKKANNEGQQYKVFYDKQQVNM